MLRSLSLGAVLFATWLLLSGFYDDPLLLGLGVVSTVLVVYIAHRMDVIDHEGHPVQLSFGGVMYWPWLLWEIVKSNIGVAKVILSPSMPATPVFFKIKSSQKTDLGRTIYANSITLTPGTITVAIDGEDFLIHALTREGAKGVMSGKMDRKVSRLEAPSETPA
ncbi:MAG: Na+/H+ antiporter subunit E [Rhodospirillales bacterium]|nr:Na+/H+ antiporter subunit E [Rhodospirillales bacterium]MCW9003285.1 Na+/H+ antiporter subunit E [Rhodospirillales bacterium]